MRSTPQKKQCDFALNSRKCGKQIPCFNTNRKIHKNTIYSLRPALRKRQEEEGRNVMFGANVSCQVSKLRRAALRHKCCIVLVTFSFVEGKA